MDIGKQLVEASKGNYNLTEGLIGCDGYAFKFMDPTELPNGLYKSSWLCAAGAHKRGNLDLDNLDFSYGFERFYDYDEKFDFLFAGSLLTMIPKLVLGGEDHFFNVVLIARTPIGRVFPLTFYYLHSGTAIGGWKYSMKEIFPPPLCKLFNFNPFKLEKPDLERLVSAIERTLRRIPVTDFKTLYECDAGRFFIKVKDGIPSINLHVERY